MNPNNNQPVGGGQPSPQPGQPSDWQQGLSTHDAPTPQPGQQVPQAGLPQQPVMPASPNSTGGMGVSPAPVSGGPSGNSRRMLMIVGAVVTLLVIGVVAFMMLSGDKKDPDANQAGQNSSNASDDNKAVELATLSAVTFNIPADMSAFNADSSKNAGYHVHITKDSAGKKVCSLEYGVLSATDLPGTDLNGIVAPQIDAVKKVGVSVDGPEPGAALVLKDSTSSDTTYSMPTLDYVFSKDGDYIVTHYSVAILSDGKRAVVSRQCSNSSEAAAKDALAKIESTAKQMTVTKQ